MAAGRSVRDPGLLDAVEALPIRSFGGIVWRATRDGRDPLQCSAAGGRWDDRTFDVLYTATHGDGALAEVYFHLSRGQPVIPSRVTYRLHELRVDLAAVVSLTMDDLRDLGGRTTTFGQLSYADRRQEYPRTQDIAEAAHFHERHGLLAPSARSEHPNLIVLCRNAGAAALRIRADHGPIDWSIWRKTPLGY